MDQTGTFEKFVSEITSNISNTPTEHIGLKDSPNSELQDESLCSVGILGILEVIESFSKKGSIMKQTWHALVDNRFIARPDNGHIGHIGCKVSDKIFQNLNHIQLGR